ncbi:hypothetical protein Cgig2_006379 [Carnegiea gigantea]|uniref:Uncharacterized protein n=1 Tax=Carnegiea gigantea TaxID=171969 RepID=A0A9Q1K4G7_9CARY|nr:hypothetical protein Cgig2_006379 [Carnegiea gigantea]
MCWLKAYLAKSQVVSTNPATLQWQGGKQYKVTQGYLWKIAGRRKAPWAKVIWAKSNIPSHTFVPWIFNTTCILWNTCDENETHLFYTSTYAKGVWEELGKWWQQMPRSQNGERMLKEMLQAKGPKARKQITGIIVTVAIYNTWRARNQAIFRTQIIPTKQTIRMIKEQVRHRILFLHSISKKYTMYKDGILQ